MRHWRVSWYYTSGEPEHEFYKYRWVAALVAFLGQAANPFCITTLTWFEKGHP